MTFKLDRSNSVQTTPALNAPTSKGEQKADSVINSQAQRSEVGLVSRGERSGARQTVLKNCARAERGISLRASSPIPGVAPETTGSSTQQSRALETSLSNLPMETVEEIARYLPAADMGALVSASRSTRDQLNARLQKRKPLLDQSKTLTAIPRERRFDTIKSILSGTHPRADVLRDLINAYGHIPLEHRATVKKAIAEKAALLPPHKRDEVLDYVNSHVLSTTQGAQGEVALSEVDSYHAAIAESGSHDPDQQDYALFILCSHIDAIPRQYRSDIFKSLGDKTDAPEVLARLSCYVPMLPVAEMSGAWHAVFEKTQNPRVLAQLARVIVDLPVSERGAAREAIVAKTQDPAVLAQLANSVG